MKHLKNLFLSFIIISMTASLSPAVVFAATDKADDITYTMDSDEVLQFDDDDFFNVCDDLTGEDLDYIKFTLPDEDDGILYYDYDEDDDDNTEVSSTKKYYYEESPYIKRIAFIPDEDYSGTLTIEYTGYDTDDNTYSGEVKISVENSTITYEIDEDEDYVEFDEDDFFDICEDMQDEDLDYIKFTLPDEDDGILYYDYDEDDDDNTEVSSSKKYYCEESPYIKRITFVPDEDYSGTLTIKYTGYDVEGEDYSGTVKITVGDDEDSSENTITYQIDDTDEVVTFDETDFDDLCQDLNDEDLDYIKFSIPSASKGILYYNYDDGHYSSVVSSSKEYYLDESPYLSDVTFVPDEDLTGICKIEFKGYDTDGDSFSGSVLVTVGSGDQNADVITYTGKPNEALLIKDSDFNSACKKITDNQLSYVYFTLPSSSYGTLYYGYSSDSDYTSKVKAATKYYYDGSPYLLNVAFVPADNYAGTTTISYTGYDTDGLSYSGKVQITISSSGSTTPIDTSTLISSKYFSDVDISYSWAVPYIDSLYTAGIISGTSTGSGTKLYSPASNVTRGDFIYLLYKTLGFSTSSTTADFSDVTSGGYYYTAIKTAKALGIVQGSENKFYPNAPITREDAMVMVLRAVNITGSTISSGDTSNLSSYSDNSLISDYSRSAVAALIRSGIITGSDDNKIYPQGYLSRAQTAAIIYRIKNL